MMCEGCEFHRVWPSGAQQCTFNDDVDIVRPCEKLNSMTVAVKNPNEEWKDVVITEDEDGDGLFLHALQNLVGGWIEILRSGDCLLIVNEEGRNIGMERNIVLNNEILVGPVVCTGKIMTDEGEDCFGIDRGVLKHLLSRGSTLRLGGSRPSGVYNAYDFTARNFKED